VQYNEATEALIAELEPTVQQLFGDRFPARWLALRLLDGDDTLLSALQSNRFGPPEDERPRAAERTLDNAAIHSQALIMRGGKRHVCK
jgi:hypothetical protein